MVIITTELAFLGNVQIIAMMRLRTLSTALIWLAALALAAQGLGADAWGDACQCAVCQCLDQAPSESCCEAHAAPASSANCGKSCCQSPARDCDSVARLPGSCCCVAADSGVPASLPKSDKARPDQPLPQPLFAAGVPTTLVSSSPVVLVTDLTFESPPPRILYCVWRI